MRILPSYSFTTKVTKVHIPKEINYNPPLYKDGIYVYQTVNGRNTICKATIIIGDGKIFN